MRQHGLAVSVQWFWPQPVWGSHLASTVSSVLWTLPWIKVTLARDCATVCCPAFAVSGWMALGQLWEVFDIVVSVALCTSLQQRSHAWASPHFVCNCVEGQKGSGWCTRPRRFRRVGEYLTDHLCSFQKKSDVCVHLQTIPADCQIYRPWLVLCPKKCWSVEVVVLFTRTSCNLDNPVVLIWPS